LFRNKIVSLKKLAFDIVQCECLNDKLPETFLMPKIFRIFAFKLS